ncbi:arabinogalactan oligomer/maltooligosaccharide transport system substrate-binding protein [Alkalihalobacillus xiaoxiensis]|uniref:Maltodextrin-binding protein n=1 Tax=Shouchella xiaoxiensis TaxID=766895 RepID=A0ABS2SVN8_9BACI|nr:extracellular solute-binding protein [Shouchella xiaoxiensis]MBM7839599.1 arabinogalactan oligomer/maltooligosaccharide transport system substrate-binding protein [Shouchella xiaoxiensis]
MKKSSLASMFLLLVFLAACAPERDEETATPSESNGTDEAAEKPEELIIWANDQEEQLEAIEKMASDYEEQSGINVKVESKPMMDQLQELALAGPEGNGPDLFFQAHDQIGNIVAQGLADPLDLSDEELANYASSSVDAVTYEFEGESNIYGVPAVIETYGIFYNKEIVPEAPETIEELKTILEENTDASADQYGFLMRPNDLYFAFPFLKNYGGYIFGGEVGEYNTDDIGLNNEGAYEGGELFQSFFGSGLIPASTTVDVVDGLFTEGKVGVVINGPWSIPTYGQALGENLGFAPFPTINGEASATFVGVKSWMVSYYSESKDWAKDLALFMTNEDNLAHYFDVAGELPPNTEVLNNLDDPIYAAFAEQIEYGVPMPSTPQMAQVWAPMNDALQFLAEGEEVESVLDEAVEQIQMNIEMGSGN